ncbi:MAG TPA: helix-turn-helix domain-containing protein [Ilumatobacter sp.]|nr:helix-turn-helix domain-containing protein [Ilumatobacter sp.]
MHRAADTPDQDLLVQSRALGDPTRHAVFAYLREAPAPVGVAELTAHFGLNHNAIRQHLAKLVEAGLVVGEQVSAEGRGRPPWKYRPVPGAAERLGGTNPFEALSMLLLELLNGGSTPREVGRRAGRRMAVEYGAEADAAEILDAVARRLGFEPHRVERGDGVDVVLGRCPFVGPAGAAPDVVCDLHLGIAEGIAEQAAGEATIGGFVVRPPERAGCRINVAVPA